MQVAKELYGSQKPKDIWTSFRKPMGTFPRRVLAFVTIAISLRILWVLLSYDRLPSFFSVEFATTTTTHWHGWANVDNLIVLYAIDT